MRKNVWVWWVGLGLALGSLAYGFYRLPLNDDDAAVARVLAPPHRPAQKPVYIPELPPMEVPQPSSEIPTLVEVSEKKIAVRVKALAREMADMWTRNPEELVVVIDDAARSMPSAPSVTLLLAIAHAETNGMILDVSEAGAVGLAQATPVAYHQEGLDGKLFVTKDYLIGSRAYIMKKPLGDADTIASLIVDKDNAATRKKAKRLLKSAKQLRREGIGELELLRPYASEKYYENIKSRDEHNRAVLKRLEKLLASGSRAQLRSFRDEVRKEYRAL